MRNEKLSIEDIVVNIAEKFTDQNCNIQSYIDVSEIVSQNIFRMTKGDQKIALLACILCLSTIEDQHLVGYDFNMSDVGNAINDLFQNSDASDLYKRLRFLIPDCNSILIS